LDLEHAARVATQTAKLAAADVREEVCWGQYSDSDKCERKIENAVSKKELSPMLHEDTKKPDESFWAIEQNETVSKSATVMDI